MLCLQITFSISAGFGTSSATGTTGLFGQPGAQQAASTGLFGQSKPLFGSSTATPQAGGFGFGTSTGTPAGTGLFGQTQQNKVSFFVVVSAVI